MDEKLLDKEVLCILDTRQIQRFLFKSNTLRDVAGGSDCLLHIQLDAVLYALEHVDPPLKPEEYDVSRDPEAPIPYFTSPKIQFQLINCAAGNTLCLVRTGELCRRLIRKISRYYLDHGYSLNLAAAATEKTENFGNDTFELYKKLNAVKASCDISDPAEPLSVVIREQKTGLPAVGLDEIYGEYYSTASGIRRKTSAQRNIVPRLREMKTTSARDGKEYAAVLHADGNNIGIIIARMLKETTSYEENIRMRRKVSRVIEEIYSRVVRKTVEEVRACWEKLPGRGEESFEYSFYVINRGGDDLNIVCDARLVVPFLKCFYRNLGGEILWKTENFTVPFCVCTGIAFITKNRHFHPGFTVAEECCARAKKAAKRPENMRNGFAGNWIDFQVCPEPKTQELERLREEDFVGRTGRSLLLRPYCLDNEAADKPYYFSRLLERAGRVRRMKLRRKQLENLRLAWSVGGEEFRNWVDQMKLSGVDLTGELGEAVCRNEEGTVCYAWYDAADFSDFMPDEENETCI